MEPLYSAEPPAKSKTPWWAWVVGVGLVGLCGLAVNRQSNREPSSEDMRRDAERVCTDDFIPKRLKAPATAEFTGVSTVFGGTAYTVTGQVDSQNTFGAQVRASFSCVVRSSGDQWVLDSAVVNG